MAWHDFVTKPVKAVGNGIKKGTKWVADKTGATRLYQEWQNWFEIFGNVDLGGGWWNLLDVTAKITIGAAIAGGVIGTAVAEPFIDYYTDKGTMGDAINCCAKLVANGIVDSWTECNHPPPPCSYDYCESFSSCGRSHWQCQMEHSCGTGVDLADLIDVACDGGGCQSTESGSTTTYDNSSNGSSPGTNSACNEFISNAALVMGHYSDDVMFVSLTLSKNYEDTNYDAVVIDSLGREHEYYCNVWSNRPNVMVCTGESVARTNEAVLAKITVYPWEQSCPLLSRTFHVMPSGSGVEDYKVGGECRQSEHACYDGAICCPNGYNCCKKDGEPSCCKKQDACTPDPSTEAGCACLGGTWVVPSMSGAPYCDY